VFSTHLSSSSDFATSPCGTFEPCPAECTAAGASTVRQCQAVQLAHYVAAAHDVDPAAFVVGDFNAQPGSFEYDQFVTGLGATDTFLAAGNAECVPATSSCSDTLDSPADADGDGVGTRLFAAAPNPFAACGPVPDPVCWVSDHSDVDPT
jgi:hypothetical protein